MLLSAKLEL